MSDKSALELAQEELASYMGPWPDEFMPDYTPQAGLLFARQVAMCCLTMVTDAAASLAGEAGDDEAVLHDVLNGVSAAVAGFTVALVALGVLPPEAEEAMVSGQA